MKTEAAYAATGFRCNSSGTTVVLVDDVCAFVGIGKVFPMSSDSIGALYNGSTAADAAVTSRPYGPQ